MINWEKLLRLSRFSKTIAPAIRIGWIVASEKIIEQLADVRMQIDYGCQYFVTNGCI